MIIDREGKEVEVEQIEDNEKLFDCFRVRVIKENNCRKFCCGEEDYQHFPSDEAVMFCIKKYEGDFAIIEKIYAIVKLPFSE